MSRSLTIAPGTLVLLVGPAGSGKSTLAARHFAGDEVLSSDAYRAAIAGDPTDQSVNDAAFERLHADVEARLAAGLTTVVDATNVLGWARAELLTRARRNRRPAVAIVLALPLDLSLARNAGRVAERVPSATVRRQDRDLRASLARLEREGFTRVLVLSDPGDVRHLRVRRSAGGRRPRAQKGRAHGNVPKERHPAH